MIKSIIVVGVLIEVSDGKMYIKTDDGDYHEVTFRGEHETPINTRLAINVDVAEDGTWSIDPNKQKYFTELETGVK